MEHAKGQLNFNTFLTVVVLGVMAWVGGSIQAHSGKLSEISQELAVLKFICAEQKEDINTLKHEAQELTMTINQIQFDLNKAHGQPQRAPILNQPKQNQP